MLGAGVALAAVTEAWFGNPWFLLTPCSVLAWLCVARYGAAWILGVQPEAALDQALGCSAMLLGAVSSLYVLDRVSEVAHACSGGQWEDSACTAGDATNAAAEALLHTGLCVCALDLMRERQEPADAARALADAVLAAWEALCFWHATVLVLVSVLTGLNVGFVTNLPRWGTSALTGFALLTKVHCAVFLGGAMLLCHLLARPLLHGSDARAPTWLEAAGAITSGIGIVCAIWYGTPAT